MPESEGGASGSLGSWHRREDWKSVTVSDRSLTGSSAFKMSGADQHRSFLIRDILGRDEEEEEEEDIVAGGGQETSDVGMC